MKQLWRNVRSLVLPTSIFILIAMLTSACDTRWCNNFWGSGRGGMGTGMGFGMGWLWWLIIIAVIGTLIYLFIFKDKGKTSESSLDILNKRYAKGEITKEEFEQMKKDITN